MSKLYSVQYLRACAALFVLFAHAFSYQIGVDNPVVVAAGRLGVVLFFVISGFIMVYISGNGPFSPAEFLTRRAARILPLYWLFSSLAALLAIFAPRLFQTTVFTWPHYLESLFFIVHKAPGRGGTSPILSLGWTLNYEVYFYIAFALLAFLAAVARVLILTAFFVAMWLAGLLLAPSDPVLQFYLSAAPLAFVVGAWIGIRYLGQAAVGDRVWPFALIAAAGLALTFLDNGTPLLREIAFAGQVLWGMGMVLAGLAAEPKLRHWNLLEQLGDASYALYLSHIFVIGAVAFLAKRVVGPDPALVPLVSAASMIAACIAAIVIHRMIEKPILRLLSGQRRNRRAVFPGAVTDLK